MSDEDGGRPAALEAIGNTPVVRLRRRLARRSAEVWVKLDRTTRPAPTRTGWRSP